MGEVGYRYIVTGAIASCFPSGNKCCYLPFHRRRTRSDMHERHKSPPKNCPSRSLSRKGQKKLVEDPPPTSYSHKQPSLKESVNIPAQNYTLRRTFENATYGFLRSSCLCNTRPEGAKQQTLKYRKERRPWLTWTAPLVARARSWYARVLAYERSGQLRKNCTWFETPSRQLRLFEEVTRGTQYGTFLSRRQSMGKDLCAPGRIYWFCIACM
jgi:hypothetical protein